MRNLYINGHLHAAVAKYLSDNRGTFTPQRFLCYVFEMYTTDVQKNRTFFDKIQRESESIQNAYHTIAAKIGNHICGDMYHDFSEQMSYKIEKDRNEIQSFNIGSESFRMPRRVNGVNIETSLMSREIIFEIGRETAHLVYNEFDKKVYLQDEFGYPIDSSELVTKIGETNYKLFVEFCELVMPIANEIPIYDKIEILTNVVNWYSKKFKSIVVGAIEILKKLEN